MESPVHAGIEFDGTILRYAEVERVGDGLRLLRLGECDFAFDPFAALRDGDDEGIDILHEALTDVFSGSQADGLRVAFHPHQVLTWTAPFPSALSIAERNERLRQEVALLTGAPAAATMLTMHPLRQDAGAEGERIDWVQVVGLDRATFGRVEALGRTMQRPGIRVGLSTQGAAASIARLGASRRSAEKPLLCGLGLYGAHAEFVVLRGEALLLSSHAEQTTGSNALFILLRLLQQLGHHAGEVAGLYVYGARVKAAALASLPPAFGHPAEAGNPLAALLVDEPGAADPFEASAYAPSVGIAL